MTLSELREKINFINSAEEPISLSLYFIIETANGNELKLADIEPAVTSTLLLQFKNYINSKLINNETLFFANLTEAEDRKNSAYYYDLEEKPVSLNFMNTVLQNEEQTKFNFNNYNLNTIKAFVILIGNQNHKITLYKKHYPINYLHRDSVLRIFPAATRFEKMDENILSINESFEFMQIENDLIILSTKVLEKHFGFEQIIRNAALANLDVIENSLLLEDITLLNTLSAELKYAKKIVRIKRGTPVLALPTSTVMTFIQQHPILKKKIRLNADNTKVSLDTKVSQELFIKLLNDDFLKSELTMLLYDSQNKDSMKTEEKT
ncbi:MAG: DUF4868 domain-containing protein [Bacteroidia bacterium]|nr:DUF4868 domain-containing protein [Bacteroidia bacterium]